MKNIKKATTYHVHYLFCTHPGLCSVALRAIGDLDWRHIELDEGKRTDRVS